MGYNCPTKNMSKEIEQVIDTKNEDGTGTVTVIATDGTTKSERYDSYYSNSQAEAVEKATQRVQSA
jgi:glutamate racemase